MKRQRIQARQLRKEYAGRRAGSRQRVVPAGARGRTMVKAAGELAGT
jgi:hypothetical protein